MKILIVDDDPNIKCIGIIAQCKVRNIEVDIARASKEAIFKICSKEGKSIDGIILDMNMPVYPHCKVELREGENVLKNLSHKKINIPVLIFSDEKIEGEYEQVFGHMKNWYDEKHKFFNFLEMLPEEKKKREELERLRKQKEEEKKRKTKETKKK